MQEMAVVRGDARVAHLRNDYLATTVTWRRRCPCVTIRGFASPPSAPRPAMPVRRTPLFAAALFTVATATACASTQPPAARPAPTPTRAAPQPAADSRAVVYEIAFPNAAHHEAQVAVTFPGVAQERPLELRMSRSSPGRYALHEFAKNVYSVRAVDSRGQALTVTRANPHQWDVHGHDGTVRVSYTIFGDRVDGTYMAVDRTHGHLNIPATFMWAGALAERAVQVTFRPGERDWRVATQLVPTGDPYTFTAPNLQYFMDSPTEVSAHELYEWPVTSGGRTQTIRLALDHVGSAEEGRRFAEMTKRVVREQEAIFGELPEFDFGTYTFIADYLPWASGDGMEHRNSTILSSTRPLATGAIANLGTVSHEFFHAWNVERLRPASLEPFDFTEANMSGELWFAEGFTQYYGNLVLRRGGFLTDSAYALVAAGISNTVINAPGRRYFSPVEMSLQAPFVDAATSVDPQNKANTFISYYTWGAGVGLALDLALRGRFGRSPDDYMRRLWTTYGRAQQNFAPARTVTRDDLRQTLGAVAGDTAFATDFFARYVTGQEAPDYATLLAHAGILLQPAEPGRAWLGDAVWRGGEGEGTGVTLASPALVGTPLYAAGVAQGDRLVSLDGRAIATTEDVAAALAARSPGDAIPLVAESRGTTLRATLTLAENPRLTAVTFEQAGRALTEEIRRFRAAWLGSKAGAD